MTQVEFIFTMKCIIEYLLHHSFCLLDGTLKSIVLLLSSFIKHMKSILMLELKALN